MGALSLDVAPAVASGEERSPARMAGVPMWALPLAVSLALLALIGPELALRPTVPSDSDLPGHLLTVELLRTELLPGGSIRGWSQDWFGGFPAYFFYFPLPGLVTALLGTLVEPALALRIVTLAAPLALPWALWVLGRWTGLGRGAVAGLVLGGSAFLLTTGSHVLGGNLLSALAGEFSYAWGLALAVLYLGLIVRGGSGVPAGLVLAAAMLSHVLPAGAAALAVAPAAIRPDTRRPVLTSWAVGAGLTAFWILPLAWNLELAGRRGWTFIPGREDLLPAELWLLLPAALMGVWLLRREPVARILVAAGAVGLAAAAVPQDLIMRGRLIPVWMLAVHALAGAGIGHALTRRPGGWRAAALVLGVAPWALVGVLRGTEDVRAFSGRVLEGIPAKPGWAELDALVSDLRARPPGRVYAEPSRHANRWGGTHAFSLIPYWTDHTTLHGLWEESATLSGLLGSLETLMSGDPLEDPNREPTAPGIAYDPARGVEILRALGTRYLITTSRATRLTVAALPEVTALGRFGDFQLFEIGPGDLVVAAPCLTAVPRRDLPPSRAWIAGWKPEAPWPAALPEGSEPAGAHARDPVDLDGGCLAAGTAGGRVTHLEIDREQIRFRTDTPGVPHLVRASFFTNWKATGAAGPYPAAPAFMAVVPEAREVTLEFGPTRVERLGALASGLTALGVILALLAPDPRTRRPPVDEDLSTAT